MTYLRLPLSEIKPRYEDAGLFRNQVVTLALVLIPHEQRTSRKDVLITGFLSDRTEIQVLFAGRRVADAAPLRAALRALRAERRQNAHAAGLPLPTTDSMRLPILAEGAWRPIFRDDGSGWQNRDFQFVAARWTMTTAGGAARSYGKLPDTHRS